MPAVLKLEDESKQLRDWSVVDVEVPGQYFAEIVSGVGGGGGRGGWGGTLTTGNSYSR